MVDANVKFVLRQFLNGCIYVVPQGIASDVRQRIQVDHLPCRGINQIRGDPVTGHATRLSPVGSRGQRNSRVIAVEAVPTSVRSGAVRIEKRGDAGKIARPHRGGGHESTKEIFPLSKSPALVVDEEERLILSDRAAQRTSKLVQIELFPGRGEVAFCIQRSVPKKLKQRSMKLVRTGFGGN